MVEIGVALVLVGAACLVAEAHAPAGALGAIGGLALAGGAALAIAGAGGGLALVLAAVLAAAVVTALWIGVAARKALAAQTGRPAAGPERLSGRHGVVRTWNGGGGQVLVEGALWRARRRWGGGDTQPLGAGGAGGGERGSGRPLRVR